MMKMIFTIYKKENDNIVLAFNNIYDINKTHTNILTHAKNIIDNKINNILNIEKNNKNHIYMSLGTYCYITAYYVNPFQNIAQFNYEALNNISIEELIYMSSDRKSTRLNSSH